MIDETRRARALLWVGIALLSAFAVLPYYWALRTSLLPPLASIRLDTPYVPLGQFRFDPYVRLWNAYAFGRYIANSVIVSSASTALAVVLAIPGAYAFARLDLPGRRALFYATVFTLMLPPIVLTVPIYEVFYRLDLLDSHLGVVLALTTLVLPLALWLLQGFFRRGVPAHLEEAALVAGTTELGAFVRVVLPLSAPAVAATALFAFLNAWNNFVWVYLLTTSEAARTATVALHFVVGSDGLGVGVAAMAASIVVVAPPVVFYGLANHAVGRGLAGR